MQYTQENVKWCCANVKCYNFVKVRGKLSFLSSMSPFILYYTKKDYKNQVHKYKVSMNQSSKTCHLLF